jgi:hypothetical protein
MYASANSPTIALDSYLTDGTGLFQVIDLAPGEGVLLENVSGGELFWQAMEDLISPLLRPIVPSNDIT